MARFTVKQELEFKKNLAIYSWVNGKSIKKVAEALGETPETILKLVSAARNKAERDINKWKREMT